MSIWFENFSLQKEIKERQTQTIATRNGFHEKRMQSARSRQYYDEYKVRMRSKMMKRRTREEMVSQTSDILLLSRQRSCWCQIGVLLFLSMSIYLVKSALVTIPIKQ
jgi:hypothetical protein